MSSSVPTSRYGVLEQTTTQTELDCAVESLKILGYAVIGGGYDSGQIESFATAFERAHAKTALEHGGLQSLADIDEHNTIRAPLACEAAFLELASNPKVLQICRRLI